MVFNLSSLETGDIILFRGNSWFSYALEWLGRSYYSHVGMIIKNPSFIDSALPDGIYILESGWEPFPIQKIIKSSMVCNFTYFLMC